jgi:AraC-like DNA-binding protein
MTSTIPLVRAGAIVPFERWLIKNGRPAAILLREADLPAEPHRDVTQPISLHRALDFLAAMQMQEGSDIGCRVVTAQSLFDLDAIGDAVLAADTPRDAFKRIAAAFPRHSSHEIFYITATETGICIHEALAMRMPGEAAHILQQYVAMLVLHLCRLATSASAPPIGFAITPHPLYGTAHLQQWLGRDVIASDSRELRIAIPDSVLHVRLPWSAPGVLSLHKPRHLDRIGAASLSDSARVLIDWMLDQGEPTIDRLAAAAGRSRRTTQRMLASEGTSFAVLLDEVRHRRALLQIAAGGAAVADIARELGYSNPSSLTRAVRRWTDESPRALRRHANGLH